MFVIFTNKYLLRRLFTVRYFFFRESEYFTCCGYQCHIGIGTRLNGQTPQVTLERSFGTINSYQSTLKVPIA